MIYWDTSAFVKCYAPLETNHARAYNLLTREKGHAASVLIHPETVSAVIRKRARDVPQREAALRLVSEHLENFELIPVEQKQVDLSLRLIREHSLRSGDAIHLAAALTMAREIGRSRLRFLSADEEQLAAAREENLRVIELAP